MLQSASYQDLDHASRSYLTALAAECNGYNNGRIKFTKEIARKYGLMSAGTRTSCLRQLQEHGFIDFTAKVKGPNPHRHCDLIRLTWHRIFEHKDWGLSEQLATNDWANWTLKNKLLQ